MKKKNFTRGMMATAIIAMGLLNACTNEEEALVSTGTPLSVAVQNGAYSRSVLIEDAFQTGAQIGVFLIEEDKTTYNEAEYHNLLYTFTDGTWGIDDVLKTPKLTDVEGKAVAYHPWSNTATDYTQVPVTTAAQKDVMYSGWTEGINNANSEATFTMKHALAAVRLAVKVDATYTTAALLSAISAQSDAFYASATMDATDGSLDNLTSSGETVSNDAVNHTLTTTAHNVDFVVVPGTTAEKITFTATVGGKPYTASFTPQNPLAQGKIHTYTLTLSATGMTVGTVAVDEWLDGESKDDLNLEPDKRGPVVNSAGKENGVYAVTATGELIAYNDAAVDATCLGVALITDNQRIMIEKMGEANAEWNSNTTFYWSENLYRKDVAGITEITDETVAKADFNGKEHTNAIIAAYTEHSMPIDARDMCSVLQTFNDGDNNVGYSDWYIPAAGQLYEIYTNKTNINAALTAMSSTVFSDNSYWSSSEFSSNNGWVVSIRNGSVGYSYSKNAYYRVRFVRDI